MSYFSPKNESENSLKLYNFNSIHKVFTEDFVLFNLPDLYKIL